MRRVTTRPGPAGQLPRARRACSIRSCPAQTEISCCYIPESDAPLTPVWSRGGAGNSPARDAPRVHGATNRQRFRAPPPSVGTEWNGCFALVDLWGSPHCSPPHHTLAGSAAKHCRPVRFIRVARHRFPAARACKPSTAAQCHDFIQFCLLWHCLIRFAPCCGLYHGQGIVGGGRLCQSRHTGRPDPISDSL